MKFAQLVIGPAGSGKSSYCNAIYEHCCVEHRIVHVLNLDPACDELPYPVSIDIRELISLNDVCEELKLGPNGGLVYCMEYLITNIQWLEDKIGDFENDYLIIDCPGQIELYSHIPVMKQLIRAFEHLNYRMCAVYALDSTFITDASKFMSGILSCLSAMIQLELPHINILTKIDLLDCKKNELNEYYEPDIQLLISKVNKDTDEHYKHLTEALGSLIATYNMVSFLPSTIKDTKTIEAILAHVDHSIQYGEDVEPKDPSKYVDDDVLEYQFNKQFENANIN